MLPYRFSIAAAWVLGGLGWCLVGLAVFQFVLALVAPPDPMLRPSGGLYLWGAVMNAGKSVAAGLSLAVLGGVARVVFGLAQRA
ncbi:hypothetical protein [Tahibacter caeni]|uniref:hypothetical protein n=1 Tax=Tahibacter caeni TaxID=1453545 RepID=UPI002148F418|nr:hypothetical protein [Tahibacter caeni]